MLSLTVSPTDRHILFTLLSVTGWSVSHPIKQSVFFQESLSMFDAHTAHRQGTCRKLFKETVSKRLLWIFQVLIL